MNNKNVFVTIMIILLIFYLSFIAPNILKSDIKTSKYFVSIFENKLTIFISLIIIYFSCHFDIKLSIFLLITFIITYYDVRKYAIQQNIKDKINNV